MSNEKILIVDDEKPNVRLLVQWIVSMGYDIETADNGEEAVRKSCEYLPDLVILDIMMPVLDGYEACRRIKANPDTMNTPVIMITALNDRESKLKGLEAGANEFLSKPLDRSEMIIRVKNLLAIKMSEDFMLRHNQILEEEVRARTQDIISMSNEMVQKLTAAAEYRDTDTGEHISRIGFYSRIIADAMIMQQEFIEELAFASLLHDIGKIGIRDDILLKPGSLTPEEFAIMKDEFFFKGFSIEVPGFVVLVVEAYCFSFHLSYFILTKASPFRISSDVSYNGRRGIHWWFEVDHPVLLLNPGEESAEFAISFKIVLQFFTIE